MSTYKATRNGMVGVDYSTKLSGFLAQGEYLAESMQANFHFLTPLQATSLHVKSTGQ